MDDLVFNINMLLVVIAIIAVFIIFVFRKKVKIAIKNNKIIMIIMLKNI